MASHLSKAGLILGPTSITWLRIAFQKNPAVLGALTAIGRYPCYFGHEPLMNLYAPCPVMELCGGCPHFALTEADEYAAKLDRLEQLQGTLQVSMSNSELISNRHRTDYRNRIRLRVDAAGQIVFFNSEKSSDCAVLLPALRTYLDELRDWSKRHSGALSPFAHLEARAPDLDCVRGLYLSYKPGIASARESLRALAHAVDAQSLATNVGSPVPTQRHGIDGRTHQRVPLDAFLQINPDVNRRLTEYVVTGALQRGCSSFADLYCGSGNFALPLAAAGLRGHGVEFVASCAAAANWAAHEQQLVSVQFSQGDAVASSRTWLSMNCLFDLVVIDPPRAGVRLGLDVISTLARQCIAYCSCNPQTLLRDIATLRQLGWQVAEVRGFDMFPGTRHLEVVAWLTR